MTEFAQLESGPLPLGPFRRYWPLLLAAVFNFVAASGVAMLIQLYIKALGGSTLAVGLSATLFWLATLLFSSAWGALSDRYPARRLALLEAVLLLNALTSAVLGELEDVPAVLALVFLRSSATVGFAPIVLALISAESRQRERGRNLSYYSSAQALGWMFGRIFAGAFLAWLGFRWSYLAAAGLPLLALLPLRQLRIGGPAPRAHPSGPAPPPAPASPSRNAAAATESGFSLQYHGLRSLYLGIALRQIGIAGTFSLIFVYMVNELGLSPALAGSVTAFNAGTQFLGMLLFGRLTDLVGRKKVFMLGFILSVLVPLVFALAHGAPLLILGFVTIGLSFSALSSGANAFIGDLAPPERQGQLLGLFRTSQGLGGVLGPLIAGALAAPTTLGFRGMFLTMSTIIALGALIALLKTEESLE